MQIDISRSDPDILYAGTDSGGVTISRDSGWGDAAKPCGSNAVRSGADSHADEGAIRLLTKPID